MPEDTKYAPLPFIFASRGVTARPITDQTPPQTYLNLDGALEREENAMSSAYGTVILNRDPDNTVSGVNYYLPNPIVSLSRLVNTTNSFRYAADNLGFLYRRVGDTQGPYTQIAANLSGFPFTGVTNTCFASSIPYLFIADAAQMLKDNGSGTPSQIGIVPPWQTAGYTPYAPNVLLIEDFLSATGFNPVNTTPSTGNFGSIASTGFANTINNFIYYVAEGVVTIAGISNAFNGVLGVPSAGSAPIALLFDIYSAPSSDQFSAYGVGGTIPYAAVVSYFMRYVAGTVSGLTTGSISKTVNLDLSQNNQVTDDDLIVLTMAVTVPDNVQQINVLFDINGSGYVNYYTKSISPQNYQSGITGADDPLTTLANEVYQAGVAGGTVTLSSPSQPSVQVFNRPMVPIEAPAGTVQGGGGTVPRLTPANLSTGAGAFITVYMRRGDFLPVGLAGQQNQTWASITGWKIEIVTNSGGSTVWKFNGLYLQWGAGPSSFGGVGYDYRYTYFNFATGTESNGSPVPQWDPQFGYVGTYGPLIVLRQAINVKGVYSPDPQVTHVQIYRRGGTFGDNWHYLDQIPNVTGTGYFNYKDIIPDKNQLQQDVLILDNDVPVTSTLPNPIYTTLRTAPTDLPGANDVYWFFGSIQIQVTNPSAVFVPGQIVDVGTPQNLEQVTVQQGGTGQFYAVLRLIHAAGEPVQVFALPAQPVDLVELAYGQMWWAGDPNNPHFLYYSKEGYPENCGPQNYIPVSQPSDPIMGIVNFRGTLYAATLTTWYIIVGGGGQTPYAQPTGSKHGLVAKHGFTKTESTIWYQCLPEDESEILTRSGWKTRDQLVISEDVLAYDMESGTCKWTPLQAINSFEYDGGMIRLTGGRKETRLDFSCTYDHTWVWDPEKRRKPYDENRVAHWDKYRWSYDVCACGSPKAKKAKKCKKCTRGRDQQLKRTQMLSKAGNIIQSAPIEEGDSLLTPREAAILGWIVTDGSISRNNGKKNGRRTARIHQAETSKHIEQIARLLWYDGSCVYKREITNGYAAKYGKTIVECDFALTTDATERLLQKAGFKSKSDLPRIVCGLNLESAKAMLEAMISADGSRGKSVVFGQNKGPVMEAFRILAFMCGHSTNAPTYSQPEGYNTEHGKTCVIKNPRLDCQGIRKTTRWYKGRVWCPTTQYGTWVSRSNDTISITGNSIDGIREFRGADGAYRSLPIEWLYRNTAQTPIPLVDLNYLDTVTMAYWQNFVYISYIEQQ